MKIGKTHKMLPALMPVHEALTKAHLISCQLVARPDVSNAIELRVAIEEVIYKLDQAVINNYAKENV